MLWDIGRVWRCMGYAVSWVRDGSSIEKRAVTEDTRCALWDNGRGGGHAGGAGYT